MTKRTTDSDFYDERREYLRATKGHAEPARRTSENKKSPSVGETSPADRRKFARFSMAIPVRLQPIHDGSPHMVENCDISWGGLRFIAPKSLVEGTDSVTITLPWRTDQQIDAIAQILRKEYLDDQRCMVAARFSELRTADHRRLEKLLKLLRGKDEDERAKGPPMADILEVFFNDIDEIREKLAEISEGYLSITTLKPYEPNQSVRLVLGGIANAPALRLRARVQEAESLDLNIGTDMVMYNLNLGFEHPLAELKAVASMLERYLPTDGPQSEPGDDSFFLDDALED